jgi:uncharacterized protein YkwD
VEVVAAANRARVKQGLSSLETNEAMMRAAMEYAAELAGRETLDHKSRTVGKEDAGERLRSVGVPWNRVGENLAMFSPRIGIAESSITGWLNSPGHRRNLLDANFRMTGAGVARDVNGNYYVVQMYANQ